VSVVPLLLEPAVDCRPADWLVDSLTTFAQSVLSVVPDGFPEYVRVFHPATLAGEPVRWDEIAGATGRVAHGGMQLCALTGSYRFESAAFPGVYDAPPPTGSLPPELTATLAAVLARHTTTPERCWFAVWNGYGTAEADLARAASFSLPAREYRLLHGPVESASEPLLAGLPDQSANIWWPDDRAWLVATEIDFKTTYLGCSLECALDLFALGAFEIYSLDPSTGITYLSDTRNPRPTLD
jgi:hypothetical protein